MDLAGSLFPLVPWVADVITLTAHAYQTKFIPAVGPAIIGRLGAVELGLGIATVVEMNKDEDGGYGGCDKAGAVLNCGSPLAKFGTYASNFGTDAKIAPSW